MIRHKEGAGNAGRSWRDKKSRHRCRQKEDREVDAMEKMMCKMGAAFGQSSNIGEYALASAVNELAAEGGRAFCVHVHIFLPQDGKNAHMYEIEKRIRDACGRREIKIGDIRRTPGSPVSRYMVSVAGISVKEGGGEGQSKMRPGQEIVLVNPIGMEGTIRLLEEQKGELEARFAPAFLSRIRGRENGLWALKAIEAGRAAGAAAIRQIGEGGIFAALWRLAEEAGTGIEADMEKMLLRQETIEVCEHLHLNPYQLASTGSLLMAAGDGEGMARQLQARGIMAAAVGAFREDKDKIVRNGEDTRYIDRPAPDELNRLYAMQPAEDLQSI